MAGVITHASSVALVACSSLPLSARFQDLGRQPYSARKWLIKYQDRALFGTDGSPDCRVEQFWTPHWRFAGTDDEHFDYPGQMRRLPARRCRAVGVSTACSCRTRSFVRSTTGTR